MTLALPRSNMPACLWQPFLIEDPAKCQFFCIWKSSQGVPRAEGLSHNMSVAQAALCQGASRDSREHKSTFVLVQSDRQAHWSRQSHHSRRLSRAISRYSWHHSRHADILAGQSQTGFTKEQHGCCSLAGKLGIYNVQTFVWTSIHGTHCLGAGNPPLSCISIVWNQKVVAAGITAGVAGHDTQGSKACQHDVLGSLQGRAQQLS